MKKINYIIEKILTLSLLKSNKNRKEVALKKRLSEIVPDLTNQYTTFKIDMNNKYISNKIRGQHTFQINLALKAIELIGSANKKLNIVDIGDSSGTHLIYLNELLAERGISARTLSVNMDTIAVNKIKSKGLNAILGKAEELHLMTNENLRPDIFLLFEVLEHLFNPIDFLHNMATKSQCEYFAITVPYVRKSRVGFHQLRKNNNQNTHAENTHIFELSPDDWDIIFKFSGWEVVYRDRYTQYPNSFPLNLTKYYWRKTDFEGFYGIVLKQNLEFSQKYLDW